MADDRGAELLAIMWAFTGIALFTVVLKVFYRAHILKGLGWDDFYILFSLLLISGCSSVFTYNVHLGMGKRPEDIMPPERISQVIKFNFIANPFGVMAYSFPNIAVAILVNQILPPNKLRAIALYALVISQCIIAGVSCVLLLTQCLPMESLWDQTIPPDSCLPPGIVSRYSYFVGGYTALTDVMLGIVPCVAFWKLKLPTKTKVGLCICMACTLFAAACAVVRTTKLWQLDNPSNFTSGTVDLTIWTIVQANVIIIAACIPTIRPFFHKTFQKAESTFDRSRRSQYSDHIYTKGGSHYAASMPSQPIRTHSMRSQPARTYSLRSQSMRTRSMRSHSMHSRSIRPPPPIPFHPTPIAAQFQTMPYSSHSTHVEGKPAVSPPIPRKSSDSQNAIWRTTDITASYEKRVDDTDPSWPLGY